MKINYDFRNFRYNGERIIQTENGPKFHAPTTKRLLKKIRHSHCQTFKDFKWVSVAIDAANNSIGFKIFFNKMYN